MVCITHTTYLHHRVYLHDRACGLHHTYTLFAQQGMWFASYVHFICTTGSVVCIIRTLDLHDRSCGLNHTYTLFAQQGVWFASYVHFICTTGLWFASYVHLICTTGRVVCITRTLYLHDEACGLRDTYTLFGRQGVWFA